ncbi:hypothetical protein KSP40_PGU015483 [Platanthera guangdongensis]|uniref:CBF1-interacting co-repressor CIR N-terminal domain-containing protein n=1 Tax=Platanthera guangdongensis TaxID=2320717 RepID=A0ABR2LQ35_9ASPA
MDDWDAGGGGDGVFRTGKRQSEKGEVDYKTKAGTAWSHSYLNQKPWHPLSYPNQRRKWIAEQTHANHERRAEEVAREFSQEQEFFRQSALFSKKEKEKMEIVKAVSFMYVRPPGYNAESAKAAEIADEKNRSDGNSVTQDLTTGTTRNDPKPEQEKLVEDKKSRPKDVFGRPLPTENEFEVLKNAPRLETGMPGRVKPFGVEIRNVRCVRCGTFGHQSGDRECPLKDAIMPNEESRLKRDDPLTAIMAQTCSVEPVKWELKQKPGMSPPHGGFHPDDPNQQIVAEEIFDEYGGFLSGGEIPTLLTNFSTGKTKKHPKNKSKHKHKSSTSRTESKVEYENQPSSSDSDLTRDIKRSKNKYDRSYENQPSPSDSDITRDIKRSKNNYDRRDENQPSSSDLDHARDIKRSKNKYDQPSDHEIYRKKSPRSRYDDRHLPKVEGSNRKTSRHKHKNSPGLDFHKENTRSRKKHCRLSSDSEDDTERRSSDKHGRCPPTLKSICRGRESRNKNYYNSYARSPHSEYERKYKI